MGVELGGRSAFGAGGSHQVTAIRRYRRGELGMAREQVPVTGYWRRHPASRP
jgi:NADPH-dependent ferric siderophore reductase